MKIETLTLSNGVEMPVIGLGVYKSGEQTYDAVRRALELGYRHIDTAAFYGNEADVGRAVRDSGIPREEIFVTTKLWNDDQRAGAQQAAFEKSLQNLDLGYIDLYLIHWPVPGKYTETWKYMQSFYDSGKVRAIGVSNFLAHHLEDIFLLGGVTPMVDQFECHPACARPALRGYCRSRSMVPVAWSPLARGRYFDDERIREIAERHKKSPAQVILRWDYQHGVVTIPKTVNPERMAENADIFDFSLTDDEMALLDWMDKNDMHGDPDNFDF